MLPHVVLFGMFVVTPLFFGLYISLHKWGMYAGEVEFVGLKYYRRLFDLDFVRTSYFWDSILVTLRFVCFSVPPLVLIALGLATFLNADFLGGWPRVILRTCFLLPAALAITVVATIGRWILLYDNGLLNHALVALGLDRVPWLTDQPGAWISIVGVTVWCTVAWNMILLLVSLQSIPASLYEAARIDGAGGLSSFWHISLPSIRPMLIFVTIIQIIASFNLFAQPQLMTAGGPERSTMPVMMFIYTDAFNAVHPRIGNGCAMAFVTGLIMLAFLLLQYRLVVRRER